MDRRVKVCKDLDIALEMIELGWFTHHARCDRDAKRVLGVAFYARGQIEMEPLLIRFDHVQNLGVMVFAWNSNRPCESKISCVSRYNSAIEPVESFALDPASVVELG